MSLEQAIAFTNGLQELSEQFKSDCQEKTDTYQATLEGQAQEFQNEAHSYAKDMTARADQLVSDVQTLYKSVYPEEGSGTPPPDQPYVDPRNKKKNV
jgi:hypothetical protein